MESEWIFSFERPWRSRTIKSSCSRALAKEIIKRDLPLFGICLRAPSNCNCQRQFPLSKCLMGTVELITRYLNIETGKGEITSQNHGFAVNREEAEMHPDIEISHVHLNDKTVAGLKMNNKKTLFGAISPRSISWTERLQVFIQ